MSLSNAQFSVILKTSSGGSVAGLSYDLATQTITPSTNRLTTETGADYWAWLLDGDYVMIYDSDGLLVGDFKQSVVNNDYPRLDFYYRPEKFLASNLIASLSKNGRLFAPQLVETDTLPGLGMNIGGQVEFNYKGVYAAKLGELWLLTSGGNYLTSSGLMIRVR